MEVNAEDEKSLASSKKSKMKQIVTGDSSSDDSDFDNDNDTEQTTSKERSIEDISASKMDDSASISATSVDVSLSSVVKNPAQRFAKISRLVGLHQVKIKKPTKINKKKAEEAFAIANSAALAAGLI